MYGTSGRACHILLTPPMEKNLSVPYISQWDATAAKTRNDCGPASVAMCLNFYGETLTSDEVFDRSGAGQGFISLSELKTAIESYGYACEAYANGTPDKIKEFLNKGIPVITVVHYGNLSSRQDTNFSGPHIFLTVGYRDDGYFVNDPDFWGQFRSHGDHHFYTRADFENAWEQSAQDGNVRNTFMVIYPKAKVIPETQMIVDTKVYADLLTKSIACDKVSDVLEYTPANGYPFTARNDPAWGDMLVEKIKNTQTSLNMYKELSERNSQSFSVSTNTTPTYTITNGTASLPQTPPQAAVEKNILLQDVSVLFDKLKKLLGGGN